MSSLYGIVLGNAIRDMKNGSVLAVINDTKLIDIFNMFRCVPSFIVFNRIRNVLGVYTKLESAIIFKALRLAEIRILSLIILNDN